MARWSVEEESNRQRATWQQMLLHKIADAHFAIAALAQALEAVRSVDNVHHLRVRHGCGRFRLARDRGMFPGKLLGRMSVGGAHRGQRLPLQGR